MVEQSMKRRSEASEEGGRGERGGLRMLWKTFLTWEGSGRTVTMFSCAKSERLVLSVYFGKEDVGLGCQRIGFDVEFESGKGLHEASSQLRSLRLEHAHHAENAWLKGRQMTYRFLRDCSG